MAVFFVTVDGDATRAQRDAFTNYLLEQKWGFWHHISNSWLVVDALNKCTAASIRDEIMKLMPRVSTIIVEATPTDYAGYSSKTGHEWLRQCITRRS